MKKTLFPTISLRRNKNTMPKLVSGFTLTEIIVVIGIMGILSGIVYGSFNSARAQSRDQRRLSDMSGIQLVLETYFNQKHQYPIDLQALVSSGYISSIPDAPMEGQYNYFPMSLNGSMPCISYQLWVMLEKNNGTAASSKRGFDSTASQPFANGMRECGSGHLSVDASTDPLIYDVIQ